MALNINGKTRLAGVIGWPLDHTLSPAMHNAAYEAMGLDWAYVPLPVHDGTHLFAVINALKSLPFVGVNVTMPYKRVMLSMCDEVATTAELAGAVNTVHVADGRLIGYNTDGRGLLEALEAEAGFRPEGKRAVILGTGGAAGAAVVGLGLGKLAHVTVAGRRVEVAEDIVDRVSGRLRETEADARELDDALRDVVESADLVVNATPVGMKPEDGSPIPPEWLQPGQLVADMIYRPAATQLMKGAVARGATAIGGLGMLVAQGAIAIETWNVDTQAAAPRELMRAAAEAALSSNGGGA